MNLFSSDVGECAVKRGETNTPSCELTTKERSSAKVIYNLATYVYTSQQVQETFQELLHQPFFHPDDASHEPPLIASWSIVGASKHVEKTTT